MTDKKRDFDKEAAAWDDNPVRAKLGADVGTAILAQMPLSKAMRVLDFGCGTGLVSLRMAPLVGTVTGVDSSRGMLDVLLAKAAKMGLDNLHAQLINPDDGGVLPGQYDAIVSSMTLHHVENTAGLLRQFHDCLVPGGRLAIADLDSEGGRFHDDNTGVFHFGFDRETLRGWLLGAGFIGVVFSTATEVVKPDIAGELHAFPVFLVCATRA